MFFFIQISAFNSLSKTIYFFVVVKCPHVIAQNNSLLHKEADQLLFSMYKQTVSSCATI